MNEGMTIAEFRSGKTWKRIYKWLEALFLALSGVYLFYAASRTTTLGLTWPAGFEKGLLAAMGVAAGLRMLSTRLFRWRTAVALGLALIYALVYRSDGYRFLLFAAAMTVGFVDIDYRRVLRMYLIAVGALCCVAVLAGELGAITNYVRAQENRGLRSAWGISYPTDFAARVFFLLLMLWVAWARLPDWAMLLPCAAYVLLARYIAYSVNGVACGLAFVCAILYCLFERRVIDRRPRLGPVKRGVDHLAAVAFPLLALVMFALMLAYARGLGFAQRVDAAMTERVRYAVEAWQEHGVTAFGTPFRQLGHGFSTFMGRDDYSFVDSSYPLILLRYGWVLTLALCVTWGWTARRAAGIGDRRLVLALGLIAIHAFAEHHFIEPHYNVLLAMPLAAYAPLGGEKAGRKKARRRAILAGAVVACVCAAVALATLPAALSGLRTVLELKGLCGGGWALAGVLALLLALVAATVWAAYRTLRAVLARRGAKPYGIGLLACLVALGGLGLYADRTVAAAALAQADMVEADRAALELAVAASTGKVRAGVLPALYHRSVEGLDYAAFFEDDMARYAGDTVLLPADAERPAFLQSGFLYAQISDAHALYTQDRAVAEALRAAGWHVTGYYSTPRAVDLAEAAELNRDLTYDPDAGLRLEKAMRPLRRGPYYDLNGGRYTVTYRLALPGGATDKDGVLITLSVTGDKGNETIAEREVTGGEFDGDGRLVVSIPFDIQDTRDLAFCARVKRHNKVNVEAIEFARTPEADVHTYYDGRGREIAQAYFTLEGAPLEQPGGYCGWEQAYGGDGRVTERRYLGADGAPVYSARYAYTDDGRVYLIDYYGPDGALLEAGSGYMHRYLQSLLGRNLTIFMAVRDEGTNALTEALYEDLAALGVQTDLRGRTQHSFYAVIAHDGVAEAASGQGAVAHAGTVGGVPYAIGSAGMPFGNYSSIAIGGVEYSPNVRGLNIVVYDNDAGAVIDAVGFDTYVERMTVTR